MSKEMVMKNDASIYVESFWKGHKTGDFEAVVAIAQESFSGMKNKINATRWLCANLAARPRMQYYIAKYNGIVAGYILWVEHGGFRPEAYLELEQIAVKESFRGKGVGSILIKSSFQNIKKDIEESDRKIKTVKITTGKDNVRAQVLYEKTLGAKIENIVKSPYRNEDIEVEMFVRY
ncbi:MAG: GNAT family N-acetyltransferase [Candidatus Staskawiczbacteria bacterium]|nr:GNAT family N-acetyltransferase [Candidatus Staskawiczbacteria bacterium]